LNGWKIDLFFVNFGQFLVPGSGFGSRGTKSMRIQTTTPLPSVHFLRLILGKPAAATTTISTTSAAIIVSSGNGTMRRDREKGKWIF
jgi:hypothetical protein